MPYFKNPFLLKYNLHRVNFILLSCTVPWVFINVYSPITYHQNPDRDYFYHLQIFSYNLLINPLSQLPIPGNHWSDSVSIVLPFQDYYMSRIIQYKSVFHIFISISEIHSCCMDQLVPFPCQMPLYCMDELQLTCLFTL